MTYRAPAYPWWRGGCGTPPERSTAGRARRAGRAGVGTRRERAGRSGGRGDRRPGGRGPRGSGRAHPQPGEEGRAAAGRRVVASVLVLIAVVVLEVVLLRDDISAASTCSCKPGAAGRLRRPRRRPTACRSGHQPPRRPGTSPGSILRAMGSCRPAAPCPCGIQVRLAPGAQQQAVTWTYRIIDRCTGATTTVPGGAVIVPGRGGRAASSAPRPSEDAGRGGRRRHTDARRAAASAPVSVGSCLREPRAG